MMINTIDFEKENFGKGHGSFSRKNLRKTMMFKGESGTFAIITKILDRDTLKITTTRSFFIEESLQRVVSLYINNYCPDMDTRLSK